MVNENVSKKGKGKGVKCAPAKESKPKKDVCLDKDPEKRALVEELGFGEVEITTQKMGKALGLNYIGITSSCHIKYPINDIFKTGSVYVLNPVNNVVIIRFTFASKPYDDKVTPKDLSEEDHNE